MLFTLVVESAPGVDLDRLRLSTVLRVVASRIQYQEEMEGEVRPADSSFAYGWYLAELSKG